MTGGRGRSRGGGGERGGGLYTSRHLDQEAADIRGSSRSPGKRSLSISSQALQYRCAQK